jgi:hypothetical protein
MQPDCAKEERFFLITCIYYYENDEGCENHEHTHQRNLERMTPQPPTPILAVY